MSWKIVKERLRSLVPSHTADLWITPLRCKQDTDEIIELMAPDRFFSSWIQANLLPLINQCLTDLSLSTKVVITVASEQNQIALPLAEPRKQLPLPSMGSIKQTRKTLHPRFTFAEFMIGESNLMARTACEALASNDNSLGHCLFIEAGPGLGKSHLTHAVAHKILSESPSTRLHYLTAQQLSAEMVKAIRENTMEQFKEKYHHQSDVLLLEDIHALSGKTKTQEELAAALDILFKQEKRVILTSKLAPRNIPNLEPELRSRLTGGLLATINPPDLRTRVHIIRKKAENGGLHLDDAVVQYLAENLKGDIRRVESAIIGVKAKMGIMGCQPNLELVKDIVCNIMGNEGLLLSTENIRDFIARQFDTPVDALLSKSRKRAIAFPRQVGMYLSRKLTGEALSDIGKTFHRDHSTVVHAIRVISEAMNSSGSVRGQVELLTEKIRKELN
ncbi:MAG: chromosomal replication initiator protein DnaA [Desulfobulbaceae bacterium]|nr:chromosomal replication initiator protein DnaA [Desulfobulbaceae bacterium]